MPRPPSDDPRQNYTVLLDSVEAAALQRLRNHYKLRFDSAAIRQAILECDARITKKKR